MIGWIVLAVYVIGWIATVQILVRQLAYNPEHEGYIPLGMLALVWPALAVIAIPACLFGALAWLVVRLLRGIGTMK